ncbi:hypothetical protein C8F01DRAFT_1247107 [Mycena amicta]|nr:hypothetical protein C8F01DRAFT_1247107 [Mycena amicta]
MEARNIIFNTYPTLAPEATPVEERDGNGRFNIYPSLAPEAAPTKQARQEMFNIYPTLAPEEEGPKTQA